MKINEIPEIAGILLQIMIFADESIYLFSFSKDLVSFLPRKRNI